MHFPRFYISPDDLNLSAENQVVLPKKTSHYLAKVLRLRVGDQIILFDGLGKEVIAEVVEITGQQVTVALAVWQTVGCESNLYTHLFQALVSPKKMDIVLQKSVELGVSEITPVVMARCQGNAMIKTFERKYQHYQQVVISACEQSGRSKIPALHMPQSFSAVLKNAQGWVLAPSCQYGLSLFPAEPPEEVAILVGPEGGLSDEEMTKITKSNWQCCSLGPRIMRTETAGLAMLAVLQATWGDWQ